VENGADINKIDNHGWTPLYIACQKGHITVVKYLVENGANINEGNNNGATPLYIAS